MKLSACSLLLLILLGCQKNKDDQAVKYLKKQFTDGLLSIEYFYTTDKDVFRMNRYSVTNGQSELSTYHLYEYEAPGKLSEVTIFYGNNSFFNKYRLNYNGNGQVSRLDDLAENNSLQNYYALDYDNNGRFTRFDIYRGSDNKRLSQGIFSYNTDGTISKIIRSGVSGNSIYTIDSSTFVFKGSLPAHWKNFEALPIIALPNSERVLWDMYCESSFRYMPNTPPFTTEMNFSIKQYDNHGYLQQQEVDIENVNGLAVGTEHRVLRYEYIE